MKQIVQYQTSDGKIHQDLKEAQDHAELRYDQALRDLVNDLKAHDFYVFDEFIDANLNRFQKLIDLKKDIQDQTPGAYEQTK